MEGTQSELETPIFISKCIYIVIHSFFLLSSHLRKFPVVFKANSTTYTFASAALLHQLYFLDHLSPCSPFFMQKSETVSALSPTHLKPSNGYHVMTIKSKLLTIAYNTLIGLQERQYQTP